MEHPEKQYLDLIQKIIETGNDKGDRTGVGTLSVFGTNMRFDLKKGFPLLTTKRVFWRGVVEELLWMLRGCTNVNLLAEKGIHIWDANATREFLDNRGLKEREVGDIGPCYGFQWRYFGAKYIDMHTNYKGQGVDQLANVVRTLKTNPNDRRIIMSAWNPSDLDAMALPPCHMFCQFYVHANTLSCMMYQRSADMGLGVPFNIASYSLLTHILANLCDMEVGEFVYNLGDTHVYKNHITALREQVTRTPRPFPSLALRQKLSTVDDMDSLTYDDFALTGYNPHPKLKMEMAV